MMTEQSDDRPKAVLSSKWTLRRRLVPEVFEKIEILLLFVWHVPFFVLVPHVSVLLDQSSSGAGGHNPVTTPARAGVSTQFLSVRCSGQVCYEYRKSDQQNRESSRQQVPLEYCPPDQLLLSLKFFVVHCLSLSFVTSA